MAKAPAAPASEIEAEDDEVSAPPAPAPAPAPKGDDVTAPFVEEFDKLTRWAKSQGYNPNSPDTPPPPINTPPINEPAPHSSDDCALGDLCPFIDEHAS